MTNSKFFRKFFELTLIMILPFVFVYRSNAADGVLDTSFNFVGYSLNDVGSAPDVRDVAIQPDGRILVLGEINNGDGFRFVLLRFNPDGSADSTFGTAGKVVLDMAPGPSGKPHCLVVLPDTKILVAGSTGSNTDWYFALVRLLPNGAKDVSFGLSGVVTTNIESRDTAVAVAALPDGRIVASGPIGGGYDFGVVRYLANGTLDTTFDGDGIVRTHIVPVDGYPSSMIIQPDGKIVAGGSFTHISSGDCGAVAVRYNTNGTPDATFGSGGIALGFVGSPCDFSDLARQPDGKLVFAGFAPGPVDGDQALVRFHPNGSPDTTFDGDGLVKTAIGPGSNRAYGLALQPDGKIVTVGESTIGTSLDFTLARYNKDGSLDSSNFGMAGVTTTALLGTDSARALKFQPDGRIVVAGNSSSRFAVARYQNKFVRHIFDYDGDGKSDISIFRPSNGQWWLNRSTAGPMAHTFGNSTDRIVPADYTGDGKTDVAIFRPASGEWFILRSEDFLYYGFPFGISTDRPAPADYDGDGIADAAVFRASTGTWYINRSTGGTTIQAFGADGDFPVPADYDGDGRADIAIFRPSLGQWWVERSSLGTIGLTFGVQGDKPVPGDYTGDGKADIALFRFQTGEWFVLRSDNSGFYSFPFGVNGDVPAPADYDGDGRFDPAIFRGNNASWYILRTTQGLLIQQYGAAGDKPTPSAFVP